MKSKKRPDDWDQGQRTTEKEEKEERRREDRWTDRQISTYWSRKELRLYSSAHYREVLGRISLPQQTLTMFWIRSSWLVFDHWEVETKVTAFKIHFSDGLGRWLHPSGSTLMTLSHAPTLWPRPIYDSQHHRSDILLFPGVSEEETLQGGDVSCPILPKSAEVGQDILGIATRMLLFWCVGIGNCVKFLIHNGVV